MTGSGPTVTIVTPSFNQGIYLDEAIRSVLDQTYLRIEYLVMDGGSSDESVQVIERHANRLAHWQSGRDEGQGAAIADGFARSSGEVLAWLNADDRLAPTAVERAMAFLAEHPDVVLVYGNRITIDARGRLLYLQPSLPIGGGSAFAHTILPQETCFFRRSAYDRVGGIRRSLRFAMDYDLFSRLACVGRVAYAGDIWAYFRKHDASKTMTEYLSVGREETAAVLREVWGRAPSPADRLAQMAKRLYALVVGGGMELFAHPREVALPPRARLRERLGSLADPPWIVRAARRLKLL